LFALSSLYSLQTKKEKSKAERLPSGIGARSAEVSSAAAGVSTSGSGLLGLTKDKVLFKDQVMQYEFYDARSQSISTGSWEDGSEDSEDDIDVTSSVPTGSGSKRKKDFVVRKSSGTGMGPVVSRDESNGRLPRENMPGWG